MFAKLCAKACYPEMIYCAWLGALAAQIVCWFGSIVATILFDNIDCFEALFIWSYLSIPSALLGVLIGGMFNLVMPNRRHIWIFLSFCIPFQLFATYALLDAHWDVAHLLSYGSTLLYPLGASLAVSVVAISLRLFLNATIPKVRGIPG